MKKISFLIIFLLFFSIFFYFSSTFLKKEKEIISENIYLGHYHLKGFSNYNLEKFLKEKTEEIEKRGIKFIAQNNNREKELMLYPTVIALTDPDLTRRVIEFDTQQTLKEIFYLNQKRDFFTRIFRNLVGKEGREEIFLKVKINEEEIRKILNNNFAELEIKAKDAELKPLKNSWQIITEQEGLIFDYEEGIEKLKFNLIRLEISPIILTGIIQKPVLKQTELESMIVKVEKFLTDFNPLNLNYGEQKWSIEQNEVRNWLSFKKEGEEIKIDFKKEKILEFLTQVAQKVNKEPQEAKFKMSEGRVIEFQMSREGRQLDLEKNEQKIKNYLLGYSITREIELEVNTIQPQIMTEDVNTLGIKELIGQGESSFAGSPKNRVHNIKIGAKVLNGILIKPGEEFSLLKAIGEISEKVGYLPELVIKGNRTIPELGGGLCQIATTTFRVALNTGLPITQRVPHAFRVIYYEPAGVDATIYPPYPDFRFINDTSAYILFQTKIEKEKLIFEFYGTSDGREVVVSQPKIFNLVSPPPARYIETEELKPGEKKKVEKAVAGAETEFTRIIIWPDNQKKYEVWKSHYRPWPEVWLIGKKEKIENGTTETEIQS